jgi:hypothetical protein
MPTANTLDWKKYESITKYIYETLGKHSGVKVKGHGQNCKVTGKSGISHQIDVLTAHSDGIHSYDTAIECKYLKQKVNKDVVMKLVQILDDTDIAKGIIVSKSGFTRDGMEYAKFKGIGLVHLREYEEKDADEAPQQIDIGILNLDLKIHITRPQILSIDIGDNRKIEIKEEYDYFGYLVIYPNGSHRSFYDFVNDFRFEIKRVNKKNGIFTGKYKVPACKLVNRQTKDEFNLDEIIFTGQLIDIDDNRNLKYTIVDKVWLLMKSIFEERMFSFSENGIIIEHKKKDL